MVRQGSAKPSLPGSSPGAAFIERLPGAFLFSCPHKVITIPFRAEKIGSFNGVIVGLKKFHRQLFDLGKNRCIRNSPHGIGRGGELYLSQTAHQTAAEGRVFSARSYRNDDGRLKAEGGRRKAEGGRRKAEGGRQKAEI